MKKESINRKNFLKKIGFGFLTIPLAKCFGRPPHERKFKGGDTPVQNQDDHCGLTDWATEGPFFVENTAESVNINFTNLPGSPIKIQGTVYGGKDGKTPLKDVKVEVWHSDDKGNYHPHGNGDIDDYEAKEIALRGHVFTNEKGEFAFHSIKPGLYYGRRRHIHYQITAPNHESLTTQTYWLAEKGDARDKADRTDKDTEDCRFIDFKNDGNGGEIGIFDVYLSA